MKVLFMLAMTLSAVASTIVASAVHFNISVPNTLRLAVTGTDIVSSRIVQPLGDPIDDIVFPD